MQAAEPASWITSSNVLINWRLQNNSKENIFTYSWPSEREIKPLKITAAKSQVWKEFLDNSLQRVTGKMPRVALPVGQNPVLPNSVCRFFFFHPKMPGAGDSKWQEAGPTMYDAEESFFFFFQLLNVAFPPLSTYPKWGNRQLQSSQKLQHKGRWCYFWYVYLWMQSTHTQWLMPSDLKLLSGFGELQKSCSLICFVVVHIFSSKG